MNRSARSIKQNIVEGWKRNSTKEYYDFLGFSIGACAELEEDCNDIWKGFYPDLMGVRGIMGEKGIEKGIMGGKGIEKGIMGGKGTETGEMGEKEIKMGEKDSEEGVMGENGIPLDSPSTPFRPFDIEKLKFYPLDKNLPPVVQLKLRCKEINFLLHKLQKSLEEKMKTEGTLAISDKFKIQKEENSQIDRAEKNLLKNFGFSRLENGKVVKTEN
jgi:hypothetical protein